VLAAAIARTPQSAKPIILLRDTERGSMRHLPVCRSIILLARKSEWTIILCQALILWKRP
jgi:hypothetical protein